MVIKGAAVYIMTNKTHTVLYTGVTTNLVKRVSEHIHGIYAKSFTSRYKIVKLVYYEVFYSINEGIAREKQIKAGSREDKIKLIESINPDWKDLFSEIE
ncbi:MAG: GIY-YIG nuclease family protein [Flavobacteriales bacterium]